MRSKESHRKKIRDRGRLNRVQQISAQGNLRKNEKQGSGDCINRSCWENIQNLQFWFRGDFANSFKRMNRYKSFISKSGDYLNILIGYYYFLKIQVHALALAINITLCNI